MEKEGFQTFIQKEFLLQVDQNLTIPVTMKLGEITQEVTIEGTTAGVDLVKATVIEVVDQRRIVDLPLNGRNPLQLQFLMPGVVFDNVSQGHGQGQNEGAVINGNRPGSNYFLMDGSTRLTLTSAWPRSFRLRMRCRSSAYKPAS